MTHDGEVEATRQQIAERVDGAGRRLRRKQRTIFVVGGLAAVIGGALAWRAFEPRAAAPWSAGFEDGARWRLAASRGTRATLHAEEEPGRGRVAHLALETVRPGDDGSWFVDLDGPPAPAGGHAAVTVVLEGTLPRVRLVLQARHDARWRSPPIEVPSRFERVRIPLDRFVREQRSGGRWTAAPGRPPWGRVVPSVRLGPAENPTGAAGVLRLASIGLE